MLYEVETKMMGKVQEDDSATTSWRRDLLRGKMVEG